MKKQFLFILLCALSFVACTQNDQSLDRTDFRRTLSANVESVLDYTRAGMESDGAFFWHEGDKIGTLMTNGNVRPMTLTAGCEGKNTGTFEINTSETIGNYAFYPYNANSSVSADGKLTINFPAEYNYGSVIGEKENSFGFAMWGQVAHGAVGFKHLGGVFKIYVNDLPVGENMQFSLSTPGKKLTGAFTTTLDCENPVLATYDDEQNNTVVIKFSNTEENATAVFYVPVPVGTYPVIDVVVKDAAGEDIAFGYWENQTVERRAQKKGTIGKKEVTGGEIDGVYSPEEGVYEISNLAGLKWVADQVNQEITTFEGETVKLTADIDLGGEQWMPIGYWVTFNGTFDGQNHTISNLKHHGTEVDCYVGLFGYTENATIKNLTINNVDIKLVADNSWAGGHMGALVGNIDGTTVIENITVSGDVKLDGDMEKMGAGRIGAVVGGNTCNATFKNVNVNANEGSFVKGNSSIGGIAGQLQGQISFENCSSNIDVTAQWFAAGGIIGLAAEHTTFTNCSTSGNISVIAGREGNNEDLYRVGGIAGSWDDNLRTALTLVDCETSCVLSGASVDGNTASPFDCGGFVGRGYSSVVGAKVIVNGVEYQYYGNGNSVSGGYQYDAEAKLATIYDAEGLSKFAEEVNGGKSFAGETVVLAADIDLAGEEWTPIGTSSNIFKGTFDGQEYTIKNLVVNGGSESYKGLFGVTYDGEIKNLVVENAKVSGRVGVGVVAGQPYTSKYTNITVKGHIEVNGLSYVGGVGGRNAYADWTNVTVEADETSYVKAHSLENGNAYRTYVGGVVGFNGEGVHTFSNITSNINVLGSTCDVGGLFGIAHYGNKFENCVCSGDVEIYNIGEEDREVAQEIGGIAGVWHNETGYTVEFTNCSFTGTLKCNIEGVEFCYDGLVGKAYNATGTGELIIDGKCVSARVAEVNGVKYATLQEAFNVGGNITLICDVTASESIILAEGKTAVLDLNGFALNGGEESTSKHIYVIKNYGSLTIKDTKGNGSINSRGVYNYGEMILNSGKISAIDGNGGYAVNNQSGSTFVMNGGWIAADYEDGDAPVSGNYDATALKVPSNATATLNGGKITNAGNFTFAIDSAGTLNIPAESTLTIEGRHGAVSISGGVTTINAGTYSVPENTEYTDNVVYVYGSGKVIINGGTFIADNDTPNGGSCVCDVVGGATINGGVFGNSSGGDVWGTTGTVIKGGQFSTDPTNYIDTEYYKVVYNNGIYTVVERKFIYLKADHWLSDNARLVAYIWTDNISAQWHDMKAVGDTKIYRFELPDNFDYGCKIIFCRMNPSSTANNWDNRWNQTADLQTPTNGNNMLTIPSNGWDGAKGTWSKYTPAN